jgi:hypothetical protein
LLQLLLLGGLIVPFDRNLRAPSLQATQPPSFDALIRHLADIVLAHTALTELPLSPSKIPITSTSLKCSNAQNSLRLLLFNASCNYGDVCENT